MLKKVLYIIIIIILTGCHGDYLSIGDGYSIVNGGLSLENDNGINYMVIVPKVFYYNSDNQYIIFLQKPDKTFINDIMNAVPSDSLKYRKILERDKNYWIIKKDGNKLFGPYNKKSYLEKCDSLNINMELNKN